VKALPTLELLWTVTVILASFAVGLSSVEHLQLFSHGRRERLSAVLASFRFLLVVGIFLYWVGGGSLLTQSIGGAFLGIVFLSYALSILWGGAFHGGSDAMVILTWSALSLGSIFQWHEGALAGLAVQLSASYFVAGVWKWRGSPEWRSGEAFERILGNSRYVSAPHRALMTRVPVSLWRMATRGVILWEVSFPLAWLGPSSTVLYLGAGFLFHLFNAWALGLNRFLWAWFALYPALLFWVGKLHTSG